MTLEPSSGSHRSLPSDLCLLIALACFLGCVHHALRADRPLFAAPRNPGYADLVSISAVEVHSQLGKPGTILVDARPENAFQKGTIPTSLSLPLHSRIDDSQIEALLGAPTVVVFCSDIRCNASKEMAVALKSRGVVQVKVFPGGIQEWKQAGYPLSSSASGLATP